MMFLDLDIELTRLIFLHLDVRDLVNLYATCMALNRFFTLESSLVEGITHKIRDKAIVARMTSVRHSEGFTILTYNRIPFSGRIVSSYINLSNDTAKKIAGLLSHLMSGYQPNNPIPCDELEVMWYDNVVEITSESVNLGIDKSIFIRLLAEYVKAIRERSRARRTMYIFDDRSVLRCRSTALLGY